MENESEEKMQRRNSMDGESVKEIEPICAP